MATTTNKGKGLTLACINCGVSKDFESIDAIKVPAREHAARNGLCKVCVDKGIKPVTKKVSKVNIVDPNGLRGIICGHYLGRVEDKAVWCDTIITGTPTELSGVKRCVEHTS